MSWFPAIPGWDGIHPAMVHFPIALLLVAPVLLLVSLFARKAWRPWAGAALLLMAIGAFAAWLAVASGHAAGQLVDKTPVLERAIARHESLGVTTRNLFTLLTVVFALTLLLPAILKKPVSGGLRVGIHVAFLVVYVACTGVLAQAANHGGRLVHEAAVRAIIDRPEPQAGMPAGAAASARVDPQPAER